MEKKRYYQGEVIEATLTYANTSTSAFSVELAQSDRSGRIQHTQFIGYDTQGKPVEDPIGWIYQQGIFGGGRVDMPELGTASISLPINQWLRFDHVGTYTIVAQTTNVLSPKDGPVKLISNKVAIEIMPLPTDEERRIIAQATREIEEGYRRRDRAELRAERNTELAAQKARAARPAIATLRYLQTPAARAALRQRLNLTPMYELADGSFALRAAFLGAPDRVAEAALILEDVQTGKLKVDDNLASLYAALKTYPLEETSFELRSRSRTEVDGLGATKAENEYHAAEALENKEIREAATKAGSLPGMH